ncbi:unnamed protein product [Cylindrotheca closterium]|uniref:Uncharacterized protein n=1 Tax=Cylindrotheca closterium TaxID=2856 RepID=A0AAD2G2C6_9STRA|nr:unnamed protein product [Cylindrotheca closterium]
MNGEVTMASTEGRQASHEIDQRLEDLGRRAYNDEFYLRYYVGHKGDYGHEFMEFELTPSGKLRYANNSNYRHDSMIRKEVDWEEPPDARQELEIKIGNEHIAFTCGEILSLVDIQKSPDPAGMKVFHYLVQDLRCLIFTLINLHFKVKPIPT